FGGGGGGSDVYYKPFYQHRLPGSRRMQPDISGGAHPVTGEGSIITGGAQGDPFVEGFGGANLCCPVVLGVLGSAPPVGRRPTARLYRLDDDAITDVDAVNSIANVSGFIHDATGTSVEIPPDLASPLQNLQDFYSALYNSPFSTRWFVLTFGTDSTLGVGQGY